MAAPSAGSHFAAEIHGLQKGHSGRQDVQGLLRLPLKVLSCDPESAEVSDLQLLWADAVRRSSGSTIMAFSSALQCLELGSLTCSSGKIIPTSLFSMKQNFNAGWLWGCLA